jgi:hypothetical protein
MIYPAKYNGVDFSGNFARESNRYDFDSQRIRNVLPSKSIYYLSFRVADPIIDIASATLKVISSVGSHTVPTTQRTNEAVNFDYNVYYSLTAADLPIGEDVCFVFSCDDYVIYSEIYHIVAQNKLSDLEICTVTASNDDNKHGYLQKRAFGFFKISKFKSDIFLNSKVEYKYSYSRNKILKSENQIGKRFTFLDLTMYNANLLKWLCNCENLFIDGVQYQLISDFTELETDDNTETMSLRADFVEYTQSFFSGSSDKLPSAPFANEFFMANGTPQLNTLQFPIFDDTFSNTFN